jgi:small-conductance mechanosensitive channel
MLYPLVAAVITRPPFLAATPSPDPSPSSISGALDSLVNNVEGSAHTCTKDDLSVCGLVLRATGNKGLGQALQVILGTPLKLVVIIVLGVIVRRFLHKVIDRLTDRIANGAASSGRAGDLAVEPAAPEASPLSLTRREARSRTLAQVLRSVTTVLVVVVLTLMVLQELGLPIAPLLASASVVGVALGLGAQSLVRDVVAGMFMIVEDQYGVGDSIDAGAASGTVEAVGLRVTRLRDLNGTVWYVRNGEIMRVGNQSQGWSRAVIDVNVGYDEDVDRVEAILLDIAERLRDDARFGIYLLDEPEVWGVEAMTEDSVVIRLVVKTYPQQQSPIARELRRRIKQRFGEEQIEMHTTPRTVIVNEEEDARPVTATHDVETLEE